MNGWKVCFSKMLSFFLGLIYVLGPNHILDFEIKDFIGQYRRKCRTLVCGAVAPEWFCQEPKGRRTWLRDSMCCREGLLPLFLLSSNDPVAYVPHVE